MLDLAACRLPRAPRHVERLRAAARARPLPLWFRRVRGSCAGIDGTCPGVHRGPKAVPEIRLGGWAKPNVGGALAGESVSESNGYASSCRQSATMPAPLRLLVLCVGGAAWVPDNSTALPHLHNARAGGRDVGVARRRRAAALAVQEPPASRSAPRSCSRSESSPARPPRPLPGGVVAAAPVGPAAGAAMQRAALRAAARARGGDVAAPPPNRVRLAGSGRLARPSARRARA